MSELEKLKKIAEYTLAEVESKGWTINVHTNCLAILRRLPKIPTPNNNKE